MSTNTLFQSLDRADTLTDDAKIVSSSLDVLTSAIVGRLIAERLVDFAGQPGQTIEYLSVCVAETIVANLDRLDTVELKRFWDAKRAEEATTR